MYSTPSLVCVGPNMYLDFLFEVGRFLDLSVDHKYGCIKPLYF